MFSYFMIALKPSKIRFITSLPPQHQTHQDLVCSNNSSPAKRSVATSGGLADDEMLARQGKEEEDKIKWPPTREQDVHWKEQISTVNKKQVSDNCTQNMHTQYRFIGTSNRRNHQTRDQLSNLDRLNKLILVIITFLYLLAGSCLQPGAAQCPWTRDAVELHSDCICDFNPSLTSNLEQEQRPINRMSVQCSPVNFQQLLRALKQTASIELPNQLISPADNRHEHSVSLDERGEEFRLAAAQLVSQAKLDLLHVSNSSIGRLVDNTFIINAANFVSSPNGSSGASPTESSAVAGPLDGRQLVVAIQSLHLSRCAIEEIQAGAFNGLEWSLTSLSLSDNQLELVPSEALKRLINLRVLDLSNNRLFKLPANSFKNLAKLNTLRLADNRLGQRPSESVPPQSNVSQMIDPAAFSGLETSLMDLNLKNTHLEVFPAAIRDLRQLAFLNLAQNQISHIPPKSFESTQSLTAINLERNRISRLDEDTFLGIEGSLSSLSLLGNLLESFPAQQLAYLSSLRRLDMGFNRIESLPANAFVSNKQLILIALDGNPLETLPEAAFKPLEGTLRGMSVGGKSLNCDCRLSWMLRWQQEFHIQISSREREPQFCSKPHYLRSLVSFAALKPEHLTCSDGTSPPQMSTSYVSILPRNSTSTGWTVNTNEPGNPMVRNNQQAATAYFTLPVQFEPTLAASTRSPGGSSGLWLARTESVQPIYTTGFATTTPTTEEPATTTTMSSFMIAQTSTSPVDPDDDSVEQSASSTSTTYSPEETTAASYVQTSTDLTEAATNNEPSSRDNDITVTSETTLPRYWTSPAAHNRSATFGERTSLGGVVYGAAPNSAELPVVDSTVSNLPEDELFVTDSSKKQNRHGFLPAMRPKQPPPSMPLEATLRRWTENITTISGSTNHRQSHQSQTEAQSERRQLHHDNRVHHSNADPSAKPVQVAVGLRQTSKPIVHSVFGTRAGDTTANQNGQRRDRNAAASSAGQQVHNGPASTVANIAGNNHSMVPAIPTTINVYRAAHQLYNQSSQSPQPLSSASSRQTLGHLLKGARFVDEQLQTGPPASATRVSNKQPSSVQHTSASTRPFTTVGSVDAPSSRLADPDIERYTLAASNHIQARVSPSSVSAGGSSASTTVSRGSEESTATSATVNQLNDAHPFRFSPPNNTRMSVSSIYRLANISLQPFRPTSTTTLPPPTTTTTSAPPQTAEGATIIEPPIDSINAARRHFNQYGHLSRTTKDPDARRTSPFNASTLTETALSAQDNVLTKLFSNRVSWRNSTAAPATTTTTSTTTTSTTTTTTRPPELSTSHTGSDGNGTTTRMAATVRFVESSQPVIWQPVAVLPSGAVTVNSSTSTTTTLKPFSVAIQTDEMPETRFGTTQLVTAPTRFASFHGSVSDKNSAINTSGLHSAASVSPSDSLLGASSSAIEVNTERVGARTVATSIRKDQRALQTDQPQVVVSHQRSPQEQQPTQGDRGSAFLEVGEQRHEARITISSGSGKQSPGHSMIAVGSASQPVERASTINLVTKDSFVPRQPRDEPETSNNSTSGGNPLHSGVHSARFFAKLAKMADFDQLALILAGLLCLFILILALTIICICYSSWSARRRKNGVASRLSSFSSSASGSANQQRQMVQAVAFGGAPISHRPAASQGGPLARLLCCCLSGPKLRRHTKRRAPTSSLALHDDDHSSGGSSQGLKTSGKSMLLANSHNTLSNQDLLFESIRRASMRLARVQNQLTSKPLAYAENNKRTKRRRSYCEQSSRDQPIDHEASIKRHLEAHQMDQEYFVGLAAARTTGRRRSTTMGALGLEGSLEGAGANQRAGTRAEHAPPDDWIRDDTLSSCDSDKSCSPGANRNNRYNISEAHRAYLGSKNANQIQASMFVTTSGNQKSGLLKTIDAHQNHRDQHLDPFDRDSRLSSDKSTTDDSRAPLNQTTRRHEYKTNRSAYLPQSAPGAAQSTLRTTTTRSFGMPVARSRSIGRLQEYPPASNFKSNHAQAVASNYRANNSADDYLISDLIPISAEEQWPEPYVDPADELPMMAPSSKERVMFAQVGRPDGNYPQQLIRSQVASQFAPTGPRQIGSSCNEDTQTRRTHTHRRTASGHRAYDDAYLANWHTMSRGAKRAVPFGYSGEQLSAEVVSGGHSSGRAQMNNEGAHEDNGSQFPGSLVRYRSIPSLSGLQPAQSQQMLNGQLTGATNWLRWTPSSFVSQELGTRDTTTTRHHSESPLQATGSSTNAPRSANRSVAEQSARNWHRDNHVESVYVAASQQR